VAIPAPGRRTLFFHSSGDLHVCSRLVVLIDIGSCLVERGMSLLLLGRQFFHAAIYCRNSSVVHNSQSNMNRNHPFHSWHSFRFNLSAAAAAMSCTAFPSSFRLLALSPLILILRGLCLLCKHTNPTPK
jgi:hypothetical protein